MQRILPEHTSFPTLSCVRKHCSCHRFLLERTRETRDGEGILSSQTDCLVRFEPARVLSSPSWRQRKSRAMFASRWERGIRGCFCAYCSGDGASCDAHFSRPKGNSDQSDHIRALQQSFLGVYSWIMAVQVDRLGNEKKQQEEANVRCLVAKDRREQPACLPSLQHTQKGSTRSCPHLIPRPPRSLAKRNSPI